MKAKDAAQWAENRRAGPWRFIWNKGVLGWGLLLWGSFAGILTLSRPEHYVVILISSALAWFLLGVFWGSGVWLLTEWEYRRYKSKNTDPDDNLAI